MAVGQDDFDSLKIQFYAVSGVLGFLVIVLAAVVIDLAVKIHKLRNEEEEETESEEGEELERRKTLSPQINHGFVIPKPNVTTNWRDDPEIRRPYDNKDFILPKPNVSKNWPPKRNMSNDFRPDDDISNYSYDERRPQQPFRISNSNFRNPLSENSDPKRNPESSDWSDRHSKTSDFNKGASNSGSHLNQFRNDNFGFRRDLQRNNNYY